MLLASSSVETKEAANILRCTEQTFTMKNYPAPSVNSASFEKSWHLIYEKLRKNNINVPMIRL